ncbi:hypothetical protein KIPB_008029 [Kipferlia bialata]|uniref:Uncharacterized protein n=1 Tax=Kipferlia bialata TaxID=797122 RepID=A0A9K3GKI7_9EUKA|nr:hypothetical protein KIPB_008029 [Kipferlia bialata]|eukprot:g8029.t1
MQNRPDWNPRIQQATRGCFMRLHDLTVLMERFRHIPEGGPIEDVDAKRFVSLLFDPRYSSFQEDRAADQERARLQARQHPVSVPPPPPQSQGQAQAMTYTPLGMERVDRVPDETRPHPTHQGAHPAPTHGPQQTLRMPYPQGQGQGQGQVPHPHPHGMQQVQQMQRGQMPQQQQYQVPHQQMQHTQVQQYPQTGRQPQYIENRPVMAVGTGGVGGRDLGPNMPTAHEYTPHRPVQGGVGAQYHQGMQPTSNGVRQQGAHGPQGTQGGAMQHTPLLQPRGQLPMGNQGMSGAMPPPQPHPQTQTQTQPSQNTQSSSSSSSLDSFSTQSSTSMTALSTQPSFEAPSSLSSQTTELSQSVSPPHSRYNKQVSLPDVVPRAAFTRPTHPVPSPPTHLAPTSATASLPVSLPQTSPARHNAYPVPASANTNTAGGVGQASLPRME